MVMMMVVMIVAAIARHHDYRTIGIVVYRGIERVMVMVGDDG